MHSNVLGNVSANKQKSKSARYKRTSGSFSLDRPMLYVTKLTFVVVGTALHLSSMVWARPDSYSVNPPGCDLLVVLVFFVGFWCVVFVLSFCNSRCQCLLSLVSFTCD